jgi:hypothetical protein
MILAQKEQRLLTITPGCTYRLDKPTANGHHGRLYRVTGFARDGITLQERVAYVGVDGPDAGEHLSASLNDFAVHFKADPPPVPAPVPANGHAPPSTPAEAPPAPAWARQAARELGEPVVVVPGPHPGLEYTGHIPFAVCLRHATEAQRKAGQEVKP